MRCVRSRGLPYVASLRVYEPLEAFPSSAREQWSARGIDHPVPGEVGALERAVAVPAVLVPERERTEVLLAPVGGELLVCPVRVQARSLLALDDLRRDLPAPVLELLVTPAALAAADKVAAAARRAGTLAAGVHVRSSTWQVPIAWFALVEDDEREIEDRDGRRSLRYRTPVAQARRRIEAALDVLEASVLTPVVPDLHDLAQWLDGFHPRGMVELDYGGLTGLLSAEELAADHSATDVREGIDALRSGHLDQAGACYLRLVTRWRALAAREHAS